MKLASKFKTATVLGAVCAAFAVPAHAEFTGSAGLGVHVWDGGYRDTDAQVWPIPAVDVETDHFYFKGLEAGGFLVKTDAHRLMLGVSYMGLGFDAGDSDDARMKKLDDRDGSFFANVTYAWRSQLGQITASIGADISGAAAGKSSARSLPTRSGTYSLIRNVLKYAGKRRGFPLPQRNSACLISLPLHRIVSLAACSSWKRPWAAPITKVRNGPLIPISGTSERSWNRIRPNQSIL